MVDGLAFPPVELVDATILVDEGDEVEVDVLKVLWWSCVARGGGGLVGFLNVWSSFRGVLKVLRPCYWVKRAAPLPQVGSQHGGWEIQASQPGSDGGLHSRENGRCRWHTLRKRYRNFKRV